MHVRALTLGTTLCLCLPLTAQTKSPLDKDLLEVTIPQLQKLYADHKYTVTQVTEWYIARIDRYNPLYRAIPDLDRKAALATAANLDAAAQKSPPNPQRTPLWGVPMLIKANTSIAGTITTEGWAGFQLPGHELLAPRDATVVAKLRAAGIVILGHTNMPDFAASDTNRSTAYGRTGNAYDVRFSPGGSSGGTVTAVTSNMAVLGTGTDTANSIRMPAATSSVVGLLPTRGLVSIAGIAPLDWLRDNTGPIARNVTDVAIALGTMVGEDPLDFRTAGSAAKAQPGPYTQYLKADALKGKRFGVPNFIVNADDGESRSLHAETFAAFMQAIEGLRAAGATVVIDGTILPSGFTKIGRLNTAPYRRQGTDLFLRDFGPAQYHSIAEYEKAVGQPIPTTIGGAQLPTPDPATAAPGARSAARGAAAATAAPPRPTIEQTNLETDPNKETNFFAPQQKALDLYNEALDRLRLDGLVYPAANMPPPDETMPQDGRISSGPHSSTGWVNTIGVPAIVLPAGFYDSGLPFGLEISARQWKDGDLLGYAYAYEQATHSRRPPILVEQGLLPNAR